MGKTRRDIVAFIIIAVISAVGLGAMSSSRKADELISLLFCRPVATVIALISDGQLNVTGNESVVITPGLKLRIPPSCSAFGFFLTLTFVLFWEGVRSRRPFFAAAVIPLAWLITIMTNSFRIICVSRWEMYCRDLLPLPPLLQHQIIGMAVFLPMLIAAYALTSYYFNSIPELSNGKCTSNSSC